MRRSITERQLFLIMAADARPEDGCIDWPWATGGKGYGQLRVDGIKYIASRLACELAHGEQPPHTCCALHHCDNPLCLNGSHLYWGTAEDNAIDRETRGRGKQLFGEDHGQAKLTDDDVFCLRVLASWGISQARLGRLWCVSPSTIGALVRGKTWKHVGDPIAGLAS